MNKSAREKCFNHRDREAAALCPECHHFFCRECVTDHDDRALCASCLGRLLPALDSRKGSLTGLRSLLKGAVGLLVLWLIFFYFGQLLLKIPSSIHERSMWREIPRETTQKAD